MRLDLLILRTMSNKCSNSSSSRLNAADRRKNKVAEKLTAALEFVRNREYNANVVCNIAYAGSIVFFLIGALSPRLPRASFPVVGNMFPTKAKFGKSKPPRTILAILFCIHFMRRILEVLFVHKFKRELNILETILGPFCIWIFSLWIAISIRPVSGYFNLYLAMYLIGIILFILGECFSLSCYANCILKQKLCTVFENFMPKCDLPGGILFPFQSGYHLFSEALSWFGFFVATGTLSTLLFFIGNFIIVVVYLIKCFRERRSNHQGKHKVINGNTIFPVNDNDVALKFECQP